MLYNIEPVNEMIMELIQVEEEIFNLLQVINYAPITEYVRAHAQNHLLIKVDHRNTLNWMLDGEFTDGIEIEEIFDYNNIKNIQRAK